MKLNYKRVLLVGMAFFLITAFWQAYDNIVPKILTDKFGLSQFWSGVIMALDNVFAVFLLPVFGMISDKHNGKYGRRTPFIFVGAILASVLLVLLSVADNIQLAALNDASINASMEAEERLSAAAAITNAAPGALIFFISVLLFALISMSLFRSPAVALMPDVTPKPLRSKANAIINLCGTAGGILILVLGIVFGTGKPQNALMSYTAFFSVTAAIMLIALTVFILTVKEKKWAQEADIINERLDAETDSETDAKKDAETKNCDAVSVTHSSLSLKARISLIFILASVALWFMGYNAVTSKYSVYAGDVLGLDYNTTLLIAQGAAIAAYIPVGIISQKFGRKKTILAGVIMLGTAFTCASFMREGSNIWVMNGLFSLAGIGWATINVNSYPMVVELAKCGDVGKYTGYYYTASMTAQIFTPILSGAFMDYKMETLFPYAAVFVALAFVTMLFVHHGDSAAVEKKSALEHLDVD